MLGAVTIYGIHKWLNPDDVVVLDAIGEPYEQVRERSHSTLPRLTELNFVNLYVTRPAIFRFNDPADGFTTPPAKFLSLGAIKEKRVDAVTLSPQLEALPLDTSMHILVDLQNQLRRGNWRPIRVMDDPPIENTFATRASIRRCNDPTAYWQAKDKLQISLNIRCFQRNGHRSEDRYLITLQLARAFVNDD